MKKVYNPESRELEQQSPDYDLFCLLKRAALSIRDSAEVVPGPHDSDDRRDFHAVQVDLEPEYPEYASACRVLRVRASEDVVKGTEELLIEMKETTLGTIAVAPEFLSSFRIFMKGKEFVQTDSVKLFRNCPKLTDIEHESINSNPEYVMQAVLGLEMWRMQVPLGTREHITRGDCESMINELNRLFSDQPQQ
jgi:hypothetical protein